MWSNPPSANTIVWGLFVLQLAQTREISVPRKLGADVALSTLAESTGETAHVSFLSGTTLYPLTSCESHRHSTRVIIDNHLLAFGPTELFDVAANNMDVYTSNNLNMADELALALHEVRQTGFGRTNRPFDVTSLAAPVFDQTGLIAGAVSVACVATRFTPTLENEIRKHLVTTSLEITHNWGGNVSENIVFSWTENMPNSKTRH